MPTGAMPELGSSLQNPLCHQGAHSLVRGSEQWASDDHIYVLQITCLPRRSTQGTGYRLTQMGGEARKRSWKLPEEVILELNLEVKIGDGHRKRRGRTLGAVSRVCAKVPGEAELGQGRVEGE